MTTPVQIPPGGAWDPRRGREESLDRIPFLSRDAYLLDVEFVATTVVVARHSLGRRFRGGFEVGRDAFSGVFSVLSPTYTGIDFDPTREVVCTTGSAATATFTIWLF